MPYKVEPVDGQWKVTSPQSTMSKGTTQGKAKGQVRLLNAIEHNSGFKPNMSSKPAEKKKTRVRPRLLGN